MTDMDADYRNHLLKLVSSINQAIAESDLISNEHQGEENLRTAKSLRSLLVQTRVGIEEKLGAESL
jgi:hypothetical protein